MASPSDWGVSRKASTFEYFSLLRDVFPSARREDSRSALRNATCFPQGASSKGAVYKGMAHITRADRCYYGAVLYTVLMR